MLPQTHSWWRGARCSLPRTPPPFSALPASGFGPSVPSLWRKNFCPLIINLDWRYWFTVFSVQYEELLKFEELLFLKSVTVQCVVLYNTQCVTVCGDWWLTGPNWNTGEFTSRVALFREVGDWGWNTGAPLKYGISGNPNCVQNEYSRYQVLWMSVSDVCPMFYTNGIVWTLTDWYSWLYCS